MNDASYRQGIPDLNLSFERYTQKVPSDGRHNQHGTEGTVRAIVAQAGLSVEEFLEL